jgi:hypothetical protein
MIDTEHIQGEVHERPQGSGELLDLRWVELSRAQHMDGLPQITRVVLRELERRTRIFFNEIDWNIGCGIES